MNSHIYIYVCIFETIKRRKVKTVPVHTVNACTESRGTAPLILNLRARGR